MRLCLLALVTLLVFACAKTHKSRVTERKDFPETLSIPTAEMDRFKVETVAEEKKEMPISKETTIATPPKIAAEPQKKNSKTKVIQPQPLPVATSVALVSPTIKYPADYPVDFKKYDAASEKFWHHFSPRLFIGEKHFIDIKYLGVTAGKIEMETMPKVMVGGKKAYHITSKLKSAEYYKYIYELEDRIDTYVSEEDFLPLKYVLTQRESGQDVDDLQLFDREKLKNSFWFYRNKKGSERREQAETYIPYYSQDSFSALYFTRGFPLKVGDVYEFPVVTRAKLWMLKFWVEAEETIDVAGAKTPAIRIRAETNLPGVLQKKGDILFWYSKDESRRILRFRAKVKIGAIEGELVKYEAPK